MNWVLAGHPPPGNVSCFLHAVRLAQLSSFSVLFVTPPFHLFVGPSGKGDSVNIATVIPCCRQFCYPLLFDHLVEHQLLRNVPPFLGHRQGRPCTLWCIVQILNHKWESQKSSTSINLSSKKHVLQGAWQSLVHPFPPIILTAHQLLVGEKRRCFPR
jgi:hypothetical protein